MRTNEAFIRKSGYFGGTVKCANKTKDQCQKETI